LPHSYALPPWVGLTLLALVFGAAFLKGGREEQVAAGAVLISLVATIVLRDPRWVGLQWGAFVSDVLLLLALTALALRTARYWPLAAAALQLLCVSIHLARIVDPGVRAWAYATGQVIFTHLLLYTIAFGVWGTWRASRTQQQPDLVVTEGVLRR
jgi:hypothetical protein